MKTRKRCFPKFRYRECDAFAEYLHSQSLDGWHFKEWKLGLVFEKGDPAEIIYDVEVLPKGSEMSLRPEMDTEEYAEYCKAAGWKMLDSQRRFCIFRKEKEGAVPIVTEEERFDNVYHAEWKSWLNLSGGILLLTLLECFEFWFLTFETWAFMNVMIFLIVMLLFQSVVSLVQAANLIRWRRKNWSKIESGEEVFYGKQKNLWRYEREIVFIVLLIGYGILAWNEFRETLPAVGILTGFMLVLAIWIAYWRPSAFDNWLAQMIGGIAIFCIVFVGIMVSIFGDGERVETRIGRSELPFEVGDFREKYAGAEIQSYDASRSASILGTAWRWDLAYYGASENRMVATLYQSEKPWVLDRVWQIHEKRLGKAYKNKPCAEMWGALEAWEITGARYYVRYPGQILIVSVPQGIEKDEIDEIREILEETGESL